MTNNKRELETNLENITNQLEKIGWSIVPNGNDIEVYYVKNHKDEYTDLKIWFPKTDGRFELERKDYGHPAILFYFKDTVIQEMENNAFAVVGKQDRNIFILFSNYERMLNK